jgi:hypothetical protein
MTVSAGGDAAHDFIPLINRLVADGVGIPGFDGRQDKLFSEPLLLLLK